MNKIALNIVAMLLLLLFPINSIGLQLIVLKCNHSGDIDVELFKNTAKAHSNACACHLTNQNQANIKTVKAVEAIKDTSAVHGSCCSEEDSIDDNQITENESNSIPQNNDYSKETIDEICCSNSHIDLSISSFSFPSIYKVNLEIDYIIAFETVSSFNIQSITKNKTDFKEVRLVLKEPISSTISYIQFQSLSKDDNSII